MAPEMVAKLIVLDLAYEGKALFCTRHIAQLKGQEFLVKWYPLKRAPKGFKRVAGGVVFVPKEVTVKTERGVKIQCTPQSCRYKDKADMLVLLLPPRKTLSWHHMPCAAKEFNERVAVYWLRREEIQLVEVVWRHSSSDVDAATVAADMTAFLEDERGEIPTFNVDNYARYDVALSYASEDRDHAEEIAKELKWAGKRVFFDHDVRSRLWGKGLSATLDEIFSKRATLCVIVVSARYKSKRWTREELRAAIKGATRTHRGDYILPVQLDATKLEELPEDIVYVPIETGSEAICADIIEKLDRA